MDDPRETKPSATRPGRATRDLQSRIAAAKRGRMVQAEPARTRSAGNSESLGRGIRLGTEFAAAVLVGAGLGYFLDLWLGTAPWIMLVMLLVGFAAGILNVTRAVGEMNKASPPPPGTDLGPDDEADDET